MSPLLDALFVAAALCGTALFAGAETAFYRVSRVRLDMEARAGGRSARLVRRLLADQTALVIVLVLGVNLCVEALTWRVEGRLHELGLTETAVSVLLSLVLVPALFFLGELLPKDLVRRRPHATLRFTAPAIAALSLALWPVVRVLALFAGLAARAAGGRGIAAGVQGREAVLGFLQEGRRSGALPDHAEVMAANVLKLRSIPIGRCMVAWADVVKFAAEAPAAEQYAAVQHSRHTRVLVTAADGSCRGYVHQLDVLGAGEDVPVLEHLRPVILLSAGISVDRALARLRAEGQRVALVGSLARPEGIVTLKDLLEEISGELPRW